MRIVLKCDIGGYVIPFIDTLMVLVVFPFSGVFRGFSFISYDIEDFL